MKNTLIIILFVLFSITSKAQTYAMQDANVSDCNGTLSDSETGPTGDYNHNENYIFTICPTGADSIILNFTSFCTELNLDVLRLFDGPDTNSPIIGIPFSGNISIPQIIATSGCLTIHFQSDASVLCTGWDASWQTIISTPPNPIFDPIVAQACNTSSITLTLDQSIVCASLNISNISIFGPVGQSITALTPIGCTNGSTNTIQVDFSPGTSQNGTYQIQLNADFTDDCGNVWPLTAFGSFNCSILEVRSMKFFFENLLNSFSSSIEVCCSFCNCVLRILAFSRFSHTNAVSVLPFITCLRHLQVV